MENKEKVHTEIHNHYEEGANCQVFNGPITGAIFAMPGSTVNQYAHDGNKATADAEGTEDGAAKAQETKASEEIATGGRVPKEELFHFVHPELNDEEAWRIHDAVKRAVRLQGISMICSYLMRLKGEKRVMLPPNPKVAYAELVRMGMPHGEGFNETTFRKYYNKSDAPNVK